MASDVKLSIIIVSFNTSKITEACLRSIYASNWRDKFEIIVVDNNSHDDSVEMIRREFPEVKIIQNRENRFFSIANNQGVKIAQGKYVLLLNSDTLVEDDNLQKMIDFFETLPDNVICIGPKILNADGSLQACGKAPWGNTFQHIIACYSFNKYLPFWRIWETLDRRPDKTHRTGWVSGCCMMIPRDKYMEVGGLNENLIFYGEEPEFGYRTNKYKLVTIYYSDAYITHLGGGQQKNQLRRV